MYKVEKGIIKCEDGSLPQSHWFCDGRLAFGYDKKGLTQIEYFNENQLNKNVCIFKRRLWDLMNFYIEDDGLNYLPNFNKITLYPYGFDSVWMHKGNEFVFSVRAIEENLVWSLKTPNELPENLKLKLELYEASAFISHDVFDYGLYDKGNNRKWQEWHWQTDMLTGRFIENDGKSHLDIALFSDTDITHSLRGGKIKKHILKSGSLKASSSYNYILAFGNSKKNLSDKKKRLKKEIGNKIDLQYARYQEIASKSPILSSPYEYLNNFFSFVPLYHESMKVQSIKGAIRAKTAYYWVWGWDGMTSNQSLCYYGDTDFLKQMLEFYQKSADDVKGIGHHFKLNMDIIEACTLPAQSMYLTLLHRYFACTHDLEVLKEHYPFAVRIFNAIETVKGMPIGISLFPDFPKLTMETGNDISLFNTTIYYCAVRALIELAKSVQDTDTEKRAEKNCKLIEKNFLKLFFNQEKGFLVNSVDAKTFEQRACYANAVKWENSFLDELLSPIKDCALKFYEENFTSESGLRPIPIWDNCYDGDSNQMHCWWPVLGHYYTRLINCGNRADLIKQYIGYIEYWSKKLTIPEGISCYAETNEPPFDNWNCTQGTWQAYSLRGWYEDIIHSIVGVEISDKGISFFPYDGEEMSITGLRYGEKIFDIHMKGSGANIKYIDFNGQRLDGRFFLPCELYLDIPYPKITVMREKS